MLPVMRSGYCHCSLTRTSLTISALMEIMTSLQYVLFFMIRIINFLKSNDRIIEFLFGYFIENQCFIIACAGNNSTQFIESHVYQFRVRKDVQPPARTGNMNPFFAKIALAVRSIGGMDIKEKDTSNEVSCLVAGEGLEPPASGL